MLALQPSPTLSMDPLYIDPAVPSSLKSSEAQKDSGASMFYQLTNIDLQCIRQQVVCPQEQVPPGSDIAHRKMSLTVPVHRSLTDVTSSRPSLGTAGPQFSCPPTPEIQPSKLPGYLLPKPALHLRKQKSVHKIREVSGRYRCIGSSYTGKEGSEKAIESTVVARSSPIIAPKCTSFQGIELSPEDDQGCKLQRNVRPLIFKRFQLRPPTVYIDQSTDCHPSSNEHSTTTSEKALPCTPMRSSYLPTEIPTDERKPPPGKSAKTFVDTKERTLLPSPWKPAISECAALLPSFARTVDDRSKDPDLNRFNPPNIDDDSGEISTPKVIALPLRLKQHLCRSMTNPKFQRSASAELKAGQQFSNEYDTPWNDATQMLENRWLHPVDLTKKEFVELVRCQGNESWFSQYSKEVQSRVVNGWVKAHHELSNAGIAPNTLTDLQLDIYELMDPLERTRFITEYKNLHAAVTLGRAGFPGLADDEAEDFMAASKGNRQKFVNNEMKEGEGPEGVGFSAKENEILRTIGFQDKEPKEEQFHQPTSFGVSKAVMKECLDNSIQKTSGVPPSTFGDSDCSSAHKRRFEPAERLMNPQDGSNDYVGPLNLEKTNASIQTPLSENLEAVEKLVLQLERTSVESTEPVKESLEGVYDGQKIVQGLKKASKQSGKTSIAEGVIKDAVKFIDGIETVANNFHAAMEAAVQSARFKIQALASEACDDLAEYPDDFVSTTLKSPSVDQRVPMQEIAKCFQSQFAEIDSTVSKLGHWTSHSSVFSLGSEINRGHFQGALQDQVDALTKSEDIKDLEIKQEKSPISEDMAIRTGDTVDDLGVAEPPAICSNTKPACLHVKFKDPPHVDNSISTRGIYRQTFSSQVDSAIMDELTLPPPDYVQNSQQIKTLRRSPTPTYSEKKPKTLRSSLSKAKLFFGSVGRNSSGRAFSSDMTD